MTNLTCTAAVSSPSAPQHTLAMPAPQLPTTTIENEKRAFRAFVEAQDSRVIKVLSLIPFIGSFASFTGYCRTKCDCSQLEDNAERASRAYNWTLPGISAEKQQEIIEREILSSRIEISKMRARNYKRASGSSSIGMVVSQILLWHPATGPALISAKIGVTLLMLLASPIIWLPGLESCTQRRRAAKEQVQLSNLPRQFAEPA